VSATERPAPPSHKGERFPAERLTREEAQRLLRQPSRRAPTGVRNAALLAAMYRGGLRLAEALALRPSDVNVRTGELHVRRGKGHKARRVAVDATGLALLQRWIDKRATLELKAGAPLFCTLAGEPIEPRYVRTMVAREARQAGIERRCNPHSLRHTFAAELAEDGVPMHVIQRALGHASLATTSVYLDHVAPVDVVAALRDRS
jgi:integrase/recombinase XerD